MAGADSAGCGRVVLTQINACRPGQAHGRLTRARPMCARQTNHIPPAFCLRDGRRAIGG